MAKLKLTANAAANVILFSSKGAQTGGLCIGNESDASGGRKREVAGPEEHSSSITQLANRQVRILVVDDEPELREMISAVLAGNGYEISQAPSGERALFELRHGKFHLVVTDILMPDRDGIEVIRHIRAHSPETKIIAISGGGDRVTLDLLGMAEALGACRILAKPLDLTSFLDTVESLIRSTLPSPLAGLE